MNRVCKYVCVCAAFALATASPAQDFRLFNRTVQVHGYASQGFAYSNNNNFLTMNSSNGSPAFTEGAINLSVPITDKFHIGAQGYSRKLGSFDDFRPELDWAYADYRAARWLGFRAGKVKTVMGLYNDTQDMEFLHTWALLPQGVYPADLRSTRIAHTGADVYGRISLRKAGKLDYTVYAGERPFDDREGSFYNSADKDVFISTIGGRTTGWDLRWTTPVKGLMFGVSWANLTLKESAIYSPAPSLAFNYSMSSNPERPWAGYGNYAKGKWDFSGEYRGTDNYVDVSIPDCGYPLLHYNTSSSSWFAAAAYRLTPKLQVGVYHSHFRVENPGNPLDTASNHIYDEVGTARYDIDRFWELKIESHFMDGYGDVNSVQGFYTRWNAGGLKPKTDMLVLRTSFNF